MSNVPSVTPSATIFVADDNPVNLKVLFTLLKTSGFKVLVATDGEIALEKLQNVTPDLILLDVAMPKLNGFEVCRKLKATVATQDIPVIFLTALDDLEHKLKGLALGAVDFISKPFQQEEVLSRVCLHLKMSALQNTLKHQNQRLSAEVAARKAAEAQLRRFNQELEQRVCDRTLELSQALQQLQAQKNQLKYEANHDLLTGLPNRPFLMKRLHNIIAQPDYDWAIFLLDLDDFKKINDGFGHFIGDELLQQVACRLQTNFNNGEIVARLGSDEFAILQHRHDSTEVIAAIAQTLIQQLQQPFILKHYLVTINISIGIVPSIAHYQNSIEILRDADFALYQAKALGKAQYTILTPSLKQQSLERIQIEADLEQALDHEEFCLHYQPIFDLNQQELVGFEALLRWKHPRKGLLFPSSFISIAEEIGLIHKLDLWALGTACQQLREWKQYFNLDDSLSININFSSVQFQCLEQLKHLNWQEYLQDLSPNNIKLEITETGFWATTTAGMEILKSLADLGIQLCIDDFGTGYSSLSRLHHFPVSILKIDRSFIQRLNEEKEGIAIVQTILNLAKNLNMKVVAEGIETTTQLEVLKNLNCDFGQGYLLSKPLDIHQATQTLSTFLFDRKSLNYA
jgi:diguanylate cyclase (GGDEF)-like protein